MPEECKLTEGEVKKWLINECRGIEKELLKNPDRMDVFCKNAACLWKKYLLNEMSIQGNCNNLITELIKDTRFELQGIQGKLKGLSSEGKFIFCTMYIMKSEVAVVQKFSSLSTSEKYELLCSSLDLWGNEILSLKLDISQKKEIYNLCAWATVYIIHQSIGEKGPYYVESGTEAIKAALDECFKSVNVSHEEKSFLIKWFTKGGTCLSGETEKANQLMPHIFYQKTPFLPIPFDEAKKIQLISDISDSSTARCLQNEFEKKYTKKQLTPEHKYWIKKAEHEVELLDEAMKGEAYKAMATEKRKKGLEILRWKDGAKKFLLSPNPQFIKPEYLEPDKLYQKLLGGGPKKNYRQVLYGWVMNKIFKEEGLDTVDPKIIYKAVTKRGNKE